jgi:hypothetical protein
MDGDACFSLCKAICIFCATDSGNELQIVFLSFLPENNLRKALVPFIGVSTLLLKVCHEKQENQAGNSGSQTGPEFLLTTDY